MNTLAVNTENKSYTAHSVFDSQSLTLTAGQTCTTLLADIRLHPDSMQGI